MWPQSICRVSILLTAFPFCSGCSKTSCQWRRQRCSNVCRWVLVLSWLECGCTCGLVENGSGFYSIVYCSLIDSAEWEYIIVFGIIYSSLRRREAASLAHLLMLMSLFRNCRLQDAEMFDKNKSTYLSNLILKHTQRYTPCMCYMCIVWSRFSL